MSVFSAFKRCVEFFVNIPLSVQIRKKNGAPCTWLLLSPQYLNYGDHLIALSETDYISGKGHVIDVNYSYFEYWGDSLNKVIKKEDIIWITGGGYLGDLWSESHKMLERIISLFPSNVIVFAPQTTYYADLNSPEARSFANIVHEHGNCVFFAREENTLERLAYLGIASTLAPDFALFSERTPSKDLASKYISFCFRSDHEGLLNGSEKNMLEETLKKYDKPIHKIVMAKDHREIPTWTRGYFVKKKIDEYARSLFVLTDRLHGMIFCCITGVPCVALDNKSKKISGVYEWVKDLKYITFVDSISNIESAIDDVMRHTDKRENRESFKRIREKLLEQYKAALDRYI